MTDDLAMTQTYYMPRPLITITLFALIGAGETEAGEELAGDTLTYSSEELVA